MGRTIQRVTFFRGRRGASLLEYIVVVGLIALVSLAGFRAFGTTVTGKANKQADCVANLGCTEGNVEPSKGKAFAPRGNFSPPPFDKIKGGKDAKWEPFKGTPYVAGPGDGSDIHPSDVSQGQLGDCYLMSGLAELAIRNPDAIKNAIHDNGDGTYTVTFKEKAPFYQFWDSGYHDVKITVKNEFPTKDGNPVFAKPGDGTGDNREMWPMIVEKAYAQWKGGYNNIEGGFGTDIMGPLTGKESSTQGGRNWEEWFGFDPGFDSIADKWDNGDALTTGTRGSGDKKPLFANGTLVGNHEYYVTNVDRKNKTITVRNPWGWNNAEVTLTYDEYKKYFTSLSSTKTR